MSVLNAKNIDIHWTVQKQIISVLPEPQPNFMQHIYWNKELTAATLLEAVFCHWDISIICSVTVSKVAATVFTSLPLFAHYDRIDLFFSVISKRIQFMTEKNRLEVGMHIMEYRILWNRIQKSEFFRIFTFEINLD